MAESLPTTQATHFEPTRCPAGKGIFTAKMQPPGVTVGGRLELAQP